MGRWPGPVRIRGVGLAAGRAAWNPVALPMIPCSIAWAVGVVLVATGMAGSAEGAPSSGGGVPARGDRSPRIIRIEGGGVVDEANVRTARETASHSTSTPAWTNEPGFEGDAFTFARLVFQSEFRPSAGRGFGPRLGWWVDYPDADLNLSWRMQQLTSLRTDPDCRVLEVMDPDLHDYPLLYLEHAGYMRLSEAEVVRLRGYLAAGGVMFANDFWNRREWEGFAGQFDRVFPGRAWRTLDTGHPLFRCVFDLRRPMHELRVPTVQFWDREFEPADRGASPHRVDRGEGSEEMTVRVLFDDAGRILVVAVHNSDVSDGWEREGENDDYFRRFSERTAYPLAINILFYLMLH